MTRVAIIGNTGGGTSTLARRLCARLAVPVYPVDLYRDRRQVLTLASPAQPRRVIEAEC